MKFFLSIFLLGLAQNFSAQHTDPESERFLTMVEQSLNAFYGDYANSTDYDSVMQALNYEANEIPSFSDEVYCMRLAKMDNMSPFEFQCNEPSLASVKFFVEQRRNFARIVLGRSALYFDLFEATLDKYEMPLELKYLAVIESGLRPQVRSHAGAMGLWQFMYGTGKYFGLQENTYIDERMDPVLATDAACRYLKKLFGIYGDWYMALAAYNAGPGNINKAIRRSGGKTTYWGIRPFLPRETQGYVPNFIGAAYLLTYHKEHNIIPAPAKIHHAQLDTICMKGGVSMQKISDLIGWDVADIKALNPIYKRDFIPETSPRQCISGPLEVIGLLVTRENELYAVPITIIDTNEILAEMEKNKGEDDEVGKIILVEPSKQVKTHTHVVTRGESLGSISREYGVTVEDIRSWNALSSTKIFVGQKLKIGGEKKEYKAEPVVRYYRVRSGDNFSFIAKRHGLTPTQLKKLNSGINIDKLKVGQKIRVK